MKWYVKLTLVFGAMILVITGFILYDQLTTGDILYRGILKGTRGLEQTIRFKIEKPEKTHILRIHPSIQSGWGDPDVYLQAVLIDPEENVLLKIDRETLFGKKKPSPLYKRSYSDYEENFSFTPTLAGRYTLKLTVLTEHVKDVYIAVMEKGN